MLPTSGYFKSIMCPFSKIGMCCRPHCHFKHLKLDGGERPPFLSTITDGDPIFERDPNLKLMTFLSTSSEDSEVAVVEPTTDATYIPTPVEKYTKPVGILKATVKSFDKPTTSAAPEYKPTPISKLKELSVSHIATEEYVPDFCNVKKKKKVEEYDPTEVRCQSKKRVSFAVASDPESEPPENEAEDSVNEEEEEEEDDDDDLETGSAPQFSDDDFEDEEQERRIVRQEPKKVVVKDDVIEEEVEIDEFSLVDKILIDSQINEQLLSGNPKKVIKTKLNGTSSKKTAKIMNEPSIESDVPSRHSSIPIDDDDSEFDEDERQMLEAFDKTYKSEQFSLPEDKSCSKLEKTETKVSKINEKKVKSSSKSSSKSSKPESPVKVKHKEKSKAKESRDKKIDSKKSKHNKDVPEVKKSTSKDKHSKSKDGKIKEKLKVVSSGKKHKEIQDGKVSSSSVSKNSKSDASTSKIKISDSDCKLKEKRTTDHKSIKRKSESGGESSSSASSSKLKHKKIKVEESLSVDDEVDVVTSDSDRDEECWKLFNEPQENSDKKEFTKKTNTAIESKSKLVGLVKKRVAHSGAEVFKKPAKPEIKKINAKEAFHNRYANIQAMVAKKYEEKMAGKNAEKKRILAPSASLLAAVTEKNKYNTQSSSSSSFSPLPPTVSRTLKDAKRIAHIPQTATKPRPIIPMEYGSKVPINVRQKYLNAFIDECLKFCLTEAEAFEIALDEEKKAYERSSSKAIYMNVSSNALGRLRRRAEDGPLDTSEVVSSTTPSTSKARNKVSHEVMLDGPQALRTSFSIERKKPKQMDQEIKGPMLYDMLKEYILTEAQLKENGFPFLHPKESGKAVIEGIYKTKFATDAFKRTCTRCQKIYYVNVDGDYVREEECDFHWGRLFRKRIAGNFESRYTCCQGDSESDGCCVNSGHVFEGNESFALKGFVQTLPKSPPPNKYYGVYALDCEMCYTTAGIELTRLTVIGPDLKPVFESFVKPENRILDYNTRFSGITEEDLVNVKTTLCDVQAVLMCIFNDKTILIGHSLESDFKALKLVHKTVVDTSVVFPHKMGLPYKRALRTLMAENLNKIIQNSVSGHDSNEDAVSCMELMIWKVKEELKSYR